MREGEAKVAQALGSALCRCSPVPTPILKAGWRHVLTIKQTAPVKRRAVRHFSAG